MKTIKTPNGIHTIIKQEGIRTLLAKHYKDGTFHEYVVCNYYSEDTGTWWHGNYFWHDLDRALEYFKSETNPNYIPRVRLEELATNCIHAMIDENIYEWYESDLDLSESEIEYFEIKKENKDEEC